MVQNRRVTSLACVMFDGQCCSMPVVTVHPTMLLRAHRALMHQPASIHRATTRHVVEFTKLAVGTKTCICLPLLIWDSPRTHWTIFTANLSNSTPTGRGGSRRMMVIGFDLILKGFDLRSEVGVPLGSFFFFLCQAQQGLYWLQFSSSALFHV